MDIQRFEPDELLQIGRQHLLRHEALNNIFFGVLADAAEGRYTGDNVFAAALHDDEVVGLSSWTPPHPVGISYGSSAETADALIGFAAATGAAELTKVLCEADTMTALAELRGEAGRPGFDLVSGQGVYELREVTHPDGVEGRMRLADDRDVRLAERWAVGFQAEVEHDSGPSVERSKRLAHELIEREQLYMWERDGEPVSMAAARGPTPNGVRISYVYTPPEERRNGYASACVAELSQKMLDDGCTFCFLFTDLENPTSNHIYQEIGYRHVGYMNMYRVP